MYLDHTFACKTFAQRNHFTFWLKVGTETELSLSELAQRKLSQKVKSLSVTLSAV